MNDFWEWFLAVFFALLISIIRTSIKRKKSRRYEEKDYSSPSYKEVNRNAASGSAVEDAYAEAVETYNSSFDDGDVDNVSRNPKEPACSANSRPVNYYSAAKHAVVTAGGRQPARNKIYMDVGTVMVGRSQGCGILYPDGTPGVSGRHCSIEWDATGGQFVVRDLGSSYGTYTDAGIRMEANVPYRLYPGSEICIGDKGNTLRLNIE